jgi:DNA-3-methyladenine glycosylase
VCAALGLDREFSGADVTSHSALWLEPMPRQPAEIVVTTRIGLSRDQHRRLRFVERGSPFVSVPP